MSGGKWPDDVRTAALTLMSQLHHQWPDATRREVCLEVTRRMDPAPSLHTLLWWGRAYTVFPTPPRLRSVRYIEPVVDETVEDDPVCIDDIEDPDEMEPATLTSGDEPVGALQEKAFDLRIELRNLAAAAEENDHLEILQAADGHLLAVEGLLRSLDGKVCREPPARRAITG